MSHSVPSVCGFWREAGPDRWFAKDEAFDAAFRSRFRDAHFAAAQRELDSWIDGAEGALALMILLDQFPRNAFRGSAHMFATDPLARHFADRAIDRGLDQQLEPEVRAFLYLPFSHSEAPADQERAVALYTALGSDDLEWAIVHRDVIARFGRFPHRNALLGRETRAEEQAFLDGGGFSG
ncbi:DUF924 family protein [Starkeya sp. ORNL1]|uniref:DUF924 family protein n=1 Tax=Starkeya sp. ORNL1 TaxID=2709380 RepID=UPI0014648978|nr:DUF924 family protein [Starkeya sp. ORNL1]QJP14880.1 DUF924 family protein [Starkeya sp. ORNL1]